MARWNGATERVPVNELHHNNVISQSTRHFLHLSRAPGSLQLMLSMTGRVDFSIEPPCVYACGQIDHPPRARTQGLQNGWNQSRGPYYTPAARAPTYMHPQIA